MGHVRLGFEITYGGSRITWLLQDQFLSKSSLINSVTIISYGSSVVSHPLPVQKDGRSNPQKDNFFLMQFEVITTLSEFFRPAVNMF